MRQRSVWFYRGVLALPLLMLGFLIASGRASAYWAMFSSAVRERGAPQAVDMRDYFATVILWIVSILPLSFAAWEISREHTAARRFNYGAIVGLREVVRRAIGRESPAMAAQRAAEFARPPRDNPTAALVWGAAIAALVPVFFASFARELRTPGGLVWLGVTGMLMGAATYCRRRAMAYLLDEPRRFDLFREWRLLNPSRYTEAGRVFVRWQIAASLLLPVWWLGGGVVIMSQQ